jgi:hypothetical protein
MPTAVNRGDRAGPEMRLENAELAHDDAGQLGRAQAHNLPYQDHRRLRGSGPRQKSTEIRRLLTGPLADMLQENEPRSLIREYYRLRRRARHLVGSADAAAGIFLVRCWPYA